MYYWFRPSVHFCEALDAERTLCGAEITGLSPTIRPLPDDADPEDLFADREATVCGNCLRIMTDAA
ncbi:hypothetical protein [Natronomonas amylolytica]|uniref:hypothetical protein n=1 Tax=Natronomonas amylolytica TaxID=3108498 RepID=UPI00300B24E4